MVRDAGVVVAVVRRHRAEETVPESGRHAVVRLRVAEVVRQVVDAQQLLAGAPHAVLTKMQERGEADLVVMGALARGRFAELVLGNTAERVLHYGDGDVLVVAPPRVAA